MPLWATGLWGRGLLRDYMAHLLFYIVQLRYYVRMFVGTPTDPCGWRLVPVVPGRRKCTITSVSHTGFLHVSYAS